MIKFIKTYSMNNLTLKSLYSVLFFSVNLIFSQTPLLESVNGSQIHSFLLQNKDQWQLSPEDLDELMVISSHYDAKTSISHVYAQQYFNNIPIFNAIVTIGIKNGRIFNAANTLAPNVQSTFNSLDPVLQPRQAISKLLEYFQLEIPSDLLLQSIDGSNFSFSAPSLSDKNIPVSLVFYPSEVGLRLSWSLNIELKHHAHWWSAIIDAQTGAVLNSYDNIINCQFHTPDATSFTKQPQFDFLDSQKFHSADGSQYRVYPLPVESPNHGSRQLIVDPANLTASPFGWHDTNGVDGAEFTITRGNNVYAYEDSVGNNQPGYSPDGGSDLTFDFALDLSGQANSYFDAAITNLFYVNNMMHDVWYNYGFDEASGNFQQNNYGNGGAQNDFVLAEAQDGSGINNANFSTPPDGGNGRMQMFLWSPATAPELLTIPGGSLTGSYAGIEAAFGGSVPTDVPLIGNLVLAFDETSPDPYDACESIQNQSFLSGNIAVIKRGTCEFGFKVLSAQNAGAIAVIMINNVAGNPIAMGAGADGGSVTIPSIMISNADGMALIAALEGGETISGELLNLGPFNQDGDFDNGIVAHEYGHGISTRLAGGANVNSCLNNPEQMGEGWSDWFALMITMEEGDLGSDISGIGTFAIGQPTDGNGIRPAPYSTDFAVNNYTYADTNDVTNISEPHGIGFVWASILWDLTWAYIDKYGFDSDLFNGTGGNNKVMQIVIEGLKLQSCSPGFVAGRNAILAADNAITGGVDQCMIWEVFANRGVGFNASEGLGFSRTDQVEDFSMPPSNDPSLVNCVLSSREFGTNQLKIFPNPASDVVHILNLYQFGNATVTISDLQGRIVYNTSGQFDGPLQIDTSKLGAGLYVLTVDNGQIKLTEKVVIQ